MLLVSSFVLPNAGGVEQFVGAVGALLEEHGFAVRVLACRLPGGDTSADASVATWYLGRSRWPLPVGGLGTIWREVGRADAVIANVPLYPLPSLAILAARRRGVPGLFVAHGSGEPDRWPGGPVARLVRALVRGTLARPAVRRSLPVSVSVAGLEGLERLYGVSGRFLPYPLPELPPAGPRPGPEPGEPLRVAWIGRLAREKDPMTAVQALDRLRADVPATLDVYGDGPLRARMEALTDARPWMTLHGSRPWPEILAAQEQAHVCLATSVWDNVMVSVLEALARGVPVVSTRVGDAPSYFEPPELAGCCVEPGDAAALAGALRAVACDYDALRAAFALNGARLRAVHRDASNVLIALIDEARARRDAR